MFLRLFLSRWFARWSSGERWSGLVAVAAGGKAGPTQKDSGGAHRRGKQVEAVIAAEIRASGRA